MLPCGVGPRISASLNKVEYSSRFALGVFFKAGTKLDLDWDCKYVDHDPVVRYIAVDNRKRGGNYSGHLFTCGICLIILSHHFVKTMIKNFESEIQK